MEFLKKKVFTYVIVGLLFGGAVLGADLINPRANLLSASLLAILNNVAEDHAPELPDLAIESIALKKVSDPSSDMNYYKYKATIVVHNYGGNLVNARVVVHGDDKQKYYVVANNDKGFSLRRGKTFIINDYDVIFDGDYNGGAIELKVEVVDKVDGDKENNAKVVEIFEGPAKIEGIDVRKVNPDGWVEVGFMAESFDLDLHKFEVIKSDEAIFEESDKRYAEKDYRKAPFEYSRIRNNSEHVEKYSEGKEFDGQSPIYLTNESSYVYLKATDPFTGNYAVSNILNFYQPQEMTRAEFAKLFVQNAGISINRDGVYYFDDVATDQWYHPYVQTLYNLGLLPTKAPLFRPDELISRTDALKMVMDYYDQDLVFGKTNSFIDAQDDVLNTYLDTLVASGKASSLGAKFYPKHAATRGFLNYLIYEHSKNN